MQHLLKGYQVNDPTWFYLSLLLILAVFFRFGRVLSLRNVDLALLLAISPGLMFIEPERVGVTSDGSSETYFWLQSIGRTWLFVGTGLLLVRALADSGFRRRPQLQPNLNASGLLFLGVAAFAFLTARAMVTPLPEAQQAVARGEQLLERRGSSAVEAPDPDRPVEGGPTATVAGAVTKAIAKTVAPSGPSANADADGNDAETVVAVRLLPVLAHLAVVLGLVLVGWKRFGDHHAGIAMATLYLLVPCTAYDVGEVNHALPAALCVWAFVAVRRPAVAGGLMGLACGVLELLPLFLCLLPVWVSFYQRRRALQFGVSLVLVGTALIVSVVALTTPDVDTFSQQIAGMFNGLKIEFLGTQLDQAGGVWNEGNLVYRIPVIVVFLVLLVVLTIWPRQKTLEHLIAHSAAIVLATQFWYSHQGGVFVLWYLPLMLLMVFRPRLEVHDPTRETATSGETVAATKPAAAGSLAGSADRPPWR